MPVSCHTHTMGPQHKPFGSCISISERMPSNPVVLRPIRRLKPSHAAFVATWTVYFGSTPFGDIESALSGRWTTPYREIQKAVQIHPTFVPLFTPATTRGTEWKTEFQKSSRCTHKSEPSALIVHITRNAVLVACI